MYNKLSQAKYQQTPKGKYANAKRKSNQRKIGWNISFKDWWDMWQASGHWEERGISAGNYMMCRTWDTGIYELGNVRIDTRESNIQERTVRLRLQKGG